MEHSQIEHAKMQSKVIGTNVRRSDVMEKVTGAAKFTADIPLPNLLYARKGAICRRRWIKFLKRHARPSS